MRNKVNVFIVVSKLGAEYMATGKMRGNCSPRQSSGLHCHVKSHFLYLSPDPSTVFSTYLTICSSKPSHTPVMVLTFPQFFQRLIGTSLQKSVNTARQNTLKSKKLSSLTVIC